MGETSRYFTIILPPTVVDVAAKSQGKRADGKKDKRKKDGSDQVETNGGKGEGRGTHVASIRDIVGRRATSAEVKLRKARKIVDHGVPLTLRWGCVKI